MHLPASLENWVSARRSSTELTHSGSKFENPPILAALGTDAQKEASSGQSVGEKNYCFTSLSTPQFQHHDRSDCTISTPDANSQYHYAVACGSADCSRRCSCQTLPRCGTDYMRREHCPRNVSTLVIQNYERSECTTQSRRRRSAIYSRCLDGSVICECSGWRDCTVAALVVL